MTKVEANRIITEEMGIYWHPEEICKTCKQITPKNPSPSDSWEDYGRVLAWAQEQKWWKKFNLENCSVGLPSFPVINTYLLNPKRGTFAVAQFILDNPNLVRRD